MKATIFILPMQNGIDQNVLNSLLSSLPISHRLRIQSISDPTHYQQSALSLCLLTHMLKAQFGYTHLPDFSYQANGKPYWQDTPAHFNVSHCPKAVAVAVSDSPIGIDIEQIFPYNQLLARKICLEEELQAHCRHANKDEALTKLWTQKEAILKWDGRGLSVPLNSINVKQFSVKSKMLKHIQCVASVCCGSDAHDEHHIRWNILDNTNFFDKFLKTS